jgi:hypothetical protein
VAGRGYGDAALWLVATLCVARAVWLGVEVRADPTPGFASYYTSARLFLEDAPVEGFYDGAAFGAEVGRRVPGIFDLFAPQPPTSVLFLWPLGLASYVTARIIWIALNGACILVSAALLVRHVGLRGGWAAAFVAMTFASHPVLRILELGQAYGIVLLMVVVALVAWRSKSAPALGGLLATTLLFKVAGALLLVVLAAERRWRVLAWTLAVAAGLVAAALPWIPTGAWLAYPAALRAMSGGTASTAYQSLPGWAMHMFRGDPVFSPSPLLHAPALAAAVVAIGATVLVAGGLAALRARGPQPAVLAAFVIAGVMINPAAQHYHYALALPAFAVLLARLAGAPRPLPGLVTALAAFLVLAPLPYQSPALVEGGLALLAYPKLAGGLLAWGLLLVRPEHPVGPMDSGRGRPES